MFTRTWILLLAMGFTLKAPPCCCGEKSVAETNRPAPCPCGRKGGAGDQESKKPLRSPHGCPNKDCSCDSKLVPDVVCDAGPLANLSRTPVQADVPFTSTLEAVSPFAGRIESHSDHGPPRSRGVPLYLVILHLVL